MKKLTLGLILMAVSTVATADDQDNRFSAGIGIGSAFSGLGANAAYISATDMTYLSAGCVSYSSANGSTCGFGAGWIKTDLFDINSDKHGFGLYTSIVDTEYSYSFTTDNDGTIRAFEQRSDIYGVGLSYTYFSNGISRPGFHYGISVHGTNAAFKNKVGGFFQIGYQF
jgi:hypothetical protein